ncbi:MAG: hypothetical protein ACREOP_11600 [Thermodesulfobacteriota bacterium]
MTSLGLIVFRYSNLEVLRNIDLVLEHIYKKLNPPASPFAKGGK